MDNVRIIIVYESILIRITVNKLFLFFLNTIFFGKIIYFY